MGGKRIEKYFDQTSAWFFWFSRRQKLLVVFRSNRKIYLSVYLCEVVYICQLVSLEKLKIFDRLMLTRRIL